MKRTSAFTLSEVIFSLGLLAFLILSVTAVLTGSLALQEGGEEDVAAANLARTVLEQWKTRPYGEIEALLTAPLPAEIFLVDGRDYLTETGVEVLTPAALNPDGDVLVVTVRLSWTELTTQTAGGGRSTREAGLEVATVVSPESAI
jgi:hypothetical protein